MPKRKPKPYLPPTPETVAAQLPPAASLLPTAERPTASAPTIPPKQSRTRKPASVGEAMSHTARMVQLTKKERDLAQRAATRIRRTLHLSMDDYAQALALVEREGDSLPNILQAAVRRGLHALTLEPPARYGQPNPLQNVPPHVTQAPPPFNPPGSAFGPGLPALAQVPSVPNTNGHLTHGQIQHPHAWGTPPPHTPRTIVTEHTEAVYTNNAPPLPSGFSLPSPHTDPDTAAQAARTRRPAWGDGVADDTAALQPHLGPPEHPSSTPRDERPWQAADDFAFPA